MLYNLESALKNMLWIRSIVCMIAISVFNFTTSYTYRILIVKLKPLIIRTYLFVFIIIPLKSFFGLSLSPDNNVAKHVREVGTITYLTSLYLLQMTHYFQYHHCSTGSITTKFEFFGS